MKAKLVRCLLWQDKSLDELLSEELNQELYKIYLELCKKETIIGVTEEQIFNEVYYHCIKLTYENPSNPDFDELEMEIKAKVGTRLVSRLVFELMYVLLSVRKNNSEEIKYIIEVLKIYGYVTKKDSYINEFIRTIKSSGDKYFLDLRPHPADVKKLEYLPIYWPEITREFDYDAIREIVELWDNIDEKLSVIDQIERAYKYHLFSRDNYLSYNRKPIRRLAILDLSNLKREIMTASNAYVCQEPLEPPTPDFQDILLEKDKEIDELKSSIAIHLSTIENLKSRLNEYKNKSQQERSFTLAMILDYIENHTNENTSMVIIGMLNLFLRNADNRTKEEMDMVDNMERKMRHFNKGDQVAGNKNNLSGSSQLVNFNLPNGLNLDQLPTVIQSIIEILKNKDNG